MKLLLHVYCWAKLNLMNELAWILLMLMVKKVYCYYGLFFLHYKQYYQKDNLPSYSHKHHKNLDILNYKLNFFSAKKVETAMVLASFGMSID